MLVVLSYRAAMNPMQGLFIYVTRMDFTKRTSSSRQSALGVKWSAYLKVSNYQPSNVAQRPLLTSSPKMLPTNEMSTLGKPQLCYFPVVVIPTMPKTSVVIFAISIYFGQRSTTT